MTIIKDSILRDSILKNSIVSASTLRQPSGTTSPYLDGILDSVVFQWDARVAESVATSGELTNLIASPADGSAQSAYDFTLGSAAVLTDGGTADGRVVCNGTSNVKTPLKGAKPAFINTLHQSSGSDFTMIFYGLREVAGNDFFRTSVNNSNPGLIFYGDNLNRLRFNQRNESVNSNALSEVDTSTLNTLNVMIVSHSRSLNKTTFWGNNSATGNTHDQTFNATTADSSDTLYMFGSSLTGNGVSAAMLNEYIDNTKAAAIIANLTAGY